MNIENILEDNLLLICPNSVKTSVLKYLASEKKLLKIKFMTLQQFKKRYLFDYDIEAIIHLVKTYKMKVANAKETLENLYYVDENKDYNSEKLKQLVDYKKELKSNNLLIYDTLFKNSLSSYKVKVYGYGKLDKFDEEIIKEVNGQIIEFEQIKDKEYKIYKFDNIEEEVEYLFDEIVRLIQEEKVDINNILVANLDKEYFPYIKRYEKYYGIEFQLPEKNSIIGTELVKDFLNELDKGFTNGVQYWFDKKTYRFEVVSELMTIVRNHCPDKNLEIENDLSDVKDLIAVDIDNNEIIKKAVIKNKAIVEEFKELLNSNDVTKLIEWLSENHSGLSYEFKKIIKEKCNVEKIIDIDSLDNYRDLILETVNNSELVSTKIEEDNKVKNKVNEFKTSLEQGFDKGVQSWFDNDAIKESTSPTSVLKSLLSIVNKYAKYSKNLQYVKDLIKDDLLHTHIKLPKKTNVIQVVNVLEPIEDNQYLFLVGFNDNIPMTYKDTEYITDNIRNEVGRSITEELNKNSTKNTLAWLSSVKKLNISYKEKSTFEEYLPSALISNLPLEKGKINEDYKLNNYWSEDLLKRKYGSMLDKYRKFSDKGQDNLLEILYGKYGESDYFSYNNKFSGIIREADDKINLSYSSMSEYYRCAFKYYISYVLHIKDKDKDNTFGADIGLVVHEYLDKVFDGGTYEEALKKGEFEEDDYKSLYLAEIVKQKMTEVVGFIKKMKDNCFVKTARKGELHELKLETNVDKAEGLSFNGRIDKLMYGETNNQVKAIIVDYKTGQYDKLKKIEDNINDVKYGFLLQLPSYMYLLSKCKDSIPELSGKIIDLCGVYYQGVLNKNPNIGDKSLEEQKNDNLKLDGYSLNDIDAMKSFDDSLNQLRDDEQYSRYIGPLKFNGEKTKFDGKSSKTINQEQIKEIISIFEKKIIEAANNIIESKFSINPKYIEPDKNMESCEYCPYECICYKTYEDREILQKEEKTKGEKSNG